MDPVTHGITGALLGKGYFSDRCGRIATAAVTFGALFPDVDVLVEAASRDPLAIVKYHRNITHSFVALPFFSALLAWLTREFVRRRLKSHSPSFGVLWLAYALGIASHIVLDGMTSFGTRMWAPISQRRVAWDFLFIIDFSLTTIVLLPQIAAWIYRDRELSRRRAWLTWLVFSAAAVAVSYLARAAGFPFRLWILLAASAIFAALFILPSLGDRGFRITRSAWCRYGVWVTVAYLLACGLAHRAAIQRVQRFAAENHIVVDRLAALPLPPSLFSWGGAIRTSDGVYQSRFDLRRATPPLFRFSQDSAPDSFIARAMKLPEVQLYWSFARFPVIRSSFENGNHVVEFIENRFVSRHAQGPKPFTYEVVFDAKGNILEEGWESNGLNLQQMRKVEPHRAGDSP
jgi:membrane-bound metal-dependent hydrolase YbcI (DUF457 family)